MPAFVPDVGMIATYWLRTGITSATTNYLSFPDDALSRLSGNRVGPVRMDSGFFDSNVLDYLEGRQLHHIIACRFNNRIKYSLTHEWTWVEVADGLQSPRHPIRRMDGRRHAVS